MQTVKGYAAHESGVFEEVTKARAGLPPRRPATTYRRRQRPTPRCSRRLVKVNAVAEAYPDLKADANFRDLQDQLAKTEDQIAFARQYYNDATAQLNQSVRDHPVDVLLRRGRGQGARVLRRPGRAHRRPGVEF